MPRSLVGGLLACIACIAGAQQPVCTAPDMAPIRALAQSVQDAGLRRQVNLLLDARIEDVVRRSGGRDGFERFIAGNITALESRRSGADAKLDADLNAAIAIQRAVGAAAQCILPSGDPRTPLQRAGAGLPVSAVGMVRKQLGQGSGTLVSRCLVVTNEHVVSKGGAIEVAVGDAVTFYAGNGRFEGFAEWVRAEIAALGARRSTGRLSDDWAVLRLDRPLGDRYGWIEVATVPPESRPSLPLWALGFPNDGVAVAGGFTQLWSHRGCRFLAEDGHRWASDCVANVGQSGGPVLALADDGRARLVAMITGIQPTPPAGPRELPEWQKRPYTVLTAADAFIGAVSVAQKHDCPDVVQERLPR